MNTRATIFGTVLYFVYLYRHSMWGRTHSHSLTTHTLTHTNIYSLMPPTSPRKLRNVCLVDVHVTHLHTLAHTLTIKGGTARHGTAKRTDARRAVAVAMQTGRTIRPNWTEHALGWWHSAPVVVRWVRMAGRQAGSLCGCLRRDCCFRWCRCPGVLVVYCKYCMCTYRIIGQPYLE